jgi:hypothetical protein
MLIISSVPCMYPKKKKEKPPGNGRVAEDKE